MPCGAKTKVLGCVRSGHRLLKHLVRHPGLREHAQGHAAIERGVVRDAVEFPFTRDAQARDLDRDCQPERKHTNQGNGRDSWSRRLRRASQADDSDEVDRQKGRERASDFPYVRVKVLTRISEVLGDDEQHARGEPCVVLPDDEAVDRDHEIQREQQRVNEAQSSCTGLNPDEPKHGEREDEEEGSVRAAFAPAHFVGEKGAE